MRRLSQEMRDLAELEETLTDVRAISNRTNAEEIVATAFRHCFGARADVLSALDRDLSEQINRRREALTERLTKEVEPT